MRYRFTTQAADSPGGLNWNNIRNPALDAMIEHMMVARTTADRNAATRAADRILLWNFYCVMALASPGYRLAYWDKFGMLEETPQLHRAAWLDTRWWDADNAKRGHN